MLVVVVIVVTVVVVTPSLCMYVHMDGSPMNRFVFEFVHGAESSGRRVCLVFLSTEAPGGRYEQNKATITSSSSSSSTSSSYTSSRSNSNSITAIATRPLLWLSL